MGMRRRQRRRRMVAVGAIAHHEGVKAGERQAEADDGYDDTGDDDAGYDEPAPQTTYAPPPADPADELEHLAQLHASGVLTDEEFTAAKAKALGQ